MEILWKFGTDRLQGSFSHGGTAYPERELRALRSSQIMVHHRTSQLVGSYENIRGGNLASIMLKFSPQGLYVAPDVPDGKEVHRKLHFATTGRFSVDVTGRATRALVKRNIF